MKTLTDDLHEFKVVLEHVNHGGDPMRTELEITAISPRLAIDAAMVAINCPRERVSTADATDHSPSDRFARYGLAFDRYFN